MNTLHTKRLIALGFIICFSVSIVVAQADNSVTVTATATTTAVPAQAHPIPTGKCSHAFKGTNDVHQPGYYTIKSSSDTPTFPILHPGDKNVLLGLFDEHAICDESINGVVVTGTVGWMTGSQAPQVIENLRVMEVTTNSSEIQIGKTVNLVPSSSLSGIPFYQDKTIDFKAGSTKKFAVYADVLPSGIPEGTSLQIQLSGFLGTGSDFNYKQIESDPLLSNFGLMTFISSMGGDFNGLNFNIEPAGSNNKILQKDTPVNDLPVTLNVSVSASSKGKDIKALQSILLKKGFFSGKIDGVWGKMTIDAIKKFQSSNALKADGKIGPKTINLLNK